jgi:carbonic anhydrase
MATMNISRQNITGVCNLKCDLNYNYPTSNCNASNYGNAISLSYDNTSVAPVKYNNVEYNVESVQIVAPSLHAYNGSQVTGEVVINHVSKTGAIPVIIYVPIIPGSISLQMLDDIINQVAAGAPNAGENTSVKTSSYTMENVVPKRQFFSYTAMNQERVVFGLTEAVKLNSETIKKLNNLITPQAPIPSGPSLYVNTLGPNKSNGDGQIYIDCQPTGNSEETTTVEDTKTTPDSTFNMDDIIKNPIFAFFLGGAIFFIVIFAFSYILTFITGGTTIIKSSKDLAKKISAKFKSNQGEEQQQV